MIIGDGVHVTSTSSLAELHAWATTYGIGRHWFHGGRHPHYDVPKRRRGDDLGYRRVRPREVLVAANQLVYQGG